MIRRSALTFAVRFSQRPLNLAFHFLLSVSYTSAMQHDIELYYRPNHSQNLLSLKLRKSRSSAGRVCCWERVRGQRERREEREKNAPRIHLDGNRALDGIHLGRHEHHARLLHGVGLRSTRTQASRTPMQTGPARAPLQRPGSWWWLRRIAREEDGDEAEIGHRSVRGVRA